MLFFIVCVCFALFPTQVISGAQSGLALCMNAVIPSLLPFMLLGACVIKSNFSRPMGAVISKILSPLTGLSPSGCICFVIGIFGGYGAGARAVCDCYKEKQISKEEANRLLVFCNNAGPLFIIGTVGIGFFSSQSIGLMLFLVQIITATISATVFGKRLDKEKCSIKSEWDFYKKNKPSPGGLITKAAIESGSAIVTACVFIITFSAITEIFTSEKYAFLSGILEVTKGCAQLSRSGYETLAPVSALLAWGGLSVHFQADALSEGKFNMKIYYAGKVFSAIFAYIITKLCFGDMNILLLICFLAVAVLLSFFVIKNLFSPKPSRQRGFRQRQHS